MIEKKLKLITIILNFFACIMSIISAILFIILVDGRMNRFTFDTDKYDSLYPTFKLITIFKIIFAVSIIVIEVAFCKKKRPLAILVIISFLISAVTVLEIINLFVVITGFHSCIIFYISCIVIITFLSSTLLVIKSKKDFSLNDKKN